MSYSNTKIEAQPLAWNCKSYPIAYSYLVNNHPNVSTQDIPFALNTFLGPRGLRVITQIETLQEIYADLEAFLREELINPFMGIGR